MGVSENQGSGLRLEDTGAPFMQWVAYTDKLHSFPPYDALSYLWLGVKNTLYMAGHPDGGGGFPNLRGPGSIFWTFRWTMKILVRLR